MNSKPHWIAFVALAGFSTLAAAQAVPNETRGELL